VVVLQATLIWNSKPQRLIRTTQLHFSLARFISTARYRIPEVCNSLRNSGEWGTVELQLILWLLGREQYLRDFFPFGVEWNRVHYYWSYLLAYCTSSGWWFFLNPILFAICTSTFRKLCKNMYTVAYRRVHSSAPL
jgi:hypothetical protein